MVVLKNFHRGNKSFVLATLLFISLSMFFLSSTIEAKNYNSKEIVFTENNSGIEVDFTLPELGISNIEGKDGESYHMLIIPGGGHLDEPGKPMLPTYSVYLQIPNEINNLAVTGTILKSCKKTDINVYPAQEHPRDLAEESGPKWIKNRDFYKNYDIAWPESKVSVSGPYIMRNIKFVMLTFYPVSYNPVEKNINVAEKMRAKIKYAGMVIASGKKSKQKINHKNPFNSVAKRFIANYKAELSSLESAGQAEMQTSSIEADIYLIITPDEFYNQAEQNGPLNRLILSKQQKGLEVMVIKTSEIGNPPTADDITTKIKDIYNTYIYPDGSPRLMYLLLAGDVEYIPVHYKNIHPETGTFTPTDLYYATMNADGDIFADIITGRLPAGNLSELNIMVSKISQREGMYYNDEFFYNMLAAAQNDMEFRITADEITSYLEAEGYWASRVYVGGEYTGTTQDIIDAINSGVFLALHRDHGSPEGWVLPSFKITDIQNLTNENQYPVIFSINCLTGYFDNNENNGETDCFGEELLKAENKGAAGFFGATAISYSGYNDELLKGFIDAAWTDFNSDYNTDFSNTTKLGAILIAGKMYMYDKYILTNESSGVSSTDTLLTEFEEFNFLGDPEHDIYKKVELPYTAEIILPLGGTISEQTEIKGTVSGNFDSYSIEIRYGNLTNEWVELTSGSSPINNGTIFNLDTTQYPDGKYILRLTAKGTQGDVVDRTVVTIQNVYINSPKANEVFDIDHLMNISVTVKAGSYSYEFSYASEELPDNWITDGFNLSSDGCNITGTLDLSFLTKNGVYLLKFRAEYNNVVSEYKVKFAAEDFLEGWPKQMDGSIKCSPTVYDIDLDGKDEVIVTATIESNSKVYAFNDDGTPVSENWPVSINSAIYSSPAVGDIDNDGNVEIVIGVSGWYLYIFNSDGTPYRYCPNGWHIFNDAMSAPVLADLDKDGFLEIIIGASYGHGTIVALNYKGENLSGWPFYGDGDCFTTAVVGDVDNDGYLDVIALSYDYNSDLGIAENKLHVLDRYGKYLPKWGGPKDFPNGTIILKPYAAGDINNDGNLEICISSFLNNNSLLSIFGNNGELLLEKEGVGSCILSLCDFEQDSKLEIVTRNRDEDGEYIQVLNNNGGIIRRYHFKESGFPYAAATSVVDIDNNGSPDIIASYGRIYAFDTYYDQNDGLIEGWPKHTNGRVIGSPCISDLDGNGDLEVVAGDENGIVYIYHIEGSMGYDKNLMQWPMFQHDAQHTGCYSSSKNNPPILDPIGNKLINEGKRLEFTITGSDVDGDVLTYSAEGLPIGAEFNKDTRTFNWIPRYDQTGEYEVTFTVSDGKLSVSETVKIMVIDSPTGAPTVEIAVSENEVKAGEEFTVTVTGSSPYGLAMIWWFGDKTTAGVPCTVNGVNYTSLYRAFTGAGGGKITAEQSWKVKINQPGPGSFKIGANSRDIKYRTRDGVPHQASEGYGIPYITVTVN